MSSASIKVAAAVILNENHECLLALRPAHKHQGGLWEFPGGKLEPGETAFQALARELQEELNLTVSSAEPLLITSHSYADKEVMLDVWVVRDFSGEPAGMEGQKLGWFSFDHLRALDFPAANLPIIDALKNLLQVK